MSHTSRIWFVLVARTLCVLTVCVGLLNGCACKDTPKKQKMADCITNVMSFKFNCPIGDHFSLVLGVPYDATNSLAFKGEIVFRQTTGVVARIVIGTNDVVRCNWLENHPDSPHIAGYILTERLDRLLSKEQVYDVDVRFAELPPLTSSLWMHWLGKIGWWQ